MNILNRLERIFGWLTIGHLPVYVVTAQAILYVWLMLNPEAEHLLILDPWAVMNGEYWRVLTFLFLVPFQNPIFTFFYLYFQYLCGISLEEQWGSFPVTLFYLIGAIGSIAAAFIIGAPMQEAFYFNEMIFLAFAALFPNFQLLLFFVIPLRVKWIAWFTWARILLGMYNTPLIWKIAVVVSLSNYLLFFTKMHFDQVRGWISHLRHKQRYKDFSS